MTKRFGAVLCVAVIALGYGACNRIVDLTPRGGPDAGFLDDAASSPPDALTGGDAFDAFAFDATPDAS